MKKEFKGALVGLAVLMSAGAVNTSGAAGMVYTETSIAGASFALDTYSTSTEKRTAVHELLFGKEEKETSAEEKKTSAETSSETAAPVTETIYAVSTAPNFVRVRSLPTIAFDSNIVGKMYTGAVAEVIESVEGQNGTWYKIRSGSVTGFVKAEYFITGTMNDPYIAGAYTLIGKVSSNTTGLNIRSGPSTDTPAITIIASGTTVAIVGDAGYFWEIQLDETCTGYVHKDYITVEKQCKTAISLSEERVLAEEDYEANNTQTPSETIPETPAPVIPSETIPETPAVPETPAETVPETPAPVIPSETIPETPAVPETPAETVPETPAPVVPVGVAASYTGGTKYVGSTVSGAELSVVGLFSDGSSYPVDGWACAEVGMALSEGSNVFTVIYQGFTCSFTVDAVVQQTQPEIDASANLRAQLVNYAMQFLGNPYVYGGTDLLNGTDCSGFTMGVYAHFGMNITRTSRSQAVAGREIALSDVQPGDLVFYTNIQTGVIGHVAMYIGNGQIVHAANETLGIITSSMYYRQPCRAVTFLN